MVFLTECFVVIEQDPMNPWWRNKKQAINFPINILGVMQDSLITESTITFTTPLHDHTS